MTVSSTTSRWEYVGDGATVNFTVNGKLFATTDLKVYLAGVLKTISTHYTVALNADQNSTPGGTVTFLTAPVLAAAVIIVRDVPATQVADLPLAGPLPSAPVEEALDRAMIVAQQLAAMFARSLRFPVTDDDALVSELGNAAARASKLLGFDASGNVEALTAALIGTLVVATDAQIYAAAAGQFAITTGSIESASAFVPIAETGAAPTLSLTQNLDWKKFINGTSTLTAARLIDNPVNGIPGEWRTILLQGSDATDRAVTFDTQFLGEVPVIIDCDSGRWYLVTIVCITATHFAASARKVKG